MLPPRRSHHCTRSTALIVRDHPARTSRPSQRLNTPSHALRTPFTRAVALHTYCAEWYRCKHREGDVPPTDRINRSRKQNQRAQSKGKTPPPNLPAGVLTTLWLGRNDPASPLARLSGHDDVLRTIIQLVQEWYRNAVTRDGVFVSRIAGVAFPQPSGLYCNMMPIRLPESIRNTCFRSAFDSTSDSTSWQSTVPKEFHGYLPLIASCPLTEEDEGAIGYLTVVRVRVRVRALTLTLP